MKLPINRMRPVHPGEILREDYLAPLNLSANALAVALCIPATRIHEIVNERRGISADTAERLARYFGGDAVSWLNLQATYDLKTLLSQPGATPAESWMPSAWMTFMMVANSGLPSLLSALYRLSRRSPVSRASCDMPCARATTPRLSMMKEGFPVSSAAVRSSVCATGEPRYFAGSKRSAFSAVVASSGCGQFLRRTYPFHGAPPILPLDNPIQRRRETLGVGGGQM